MDHYGFWSLVPPLLAIVMAITTRQVIFSLTLGIFAGWLILSGGRPITAFLGTLDALVSVFKSEGNTRTVFFTLFIGALIALMRHVGGVNGFTQWITRRFENSRHPNRRLQMGAATVGFLLFIESNISILTVGTVFRPLFDRYGLSREKLAYLADSSSAPSCILFPINAWGAYIMGLLAAYEGIDPFGTLVGSIPYNFYAILTLLLVFFIAYSGNDFSAMKHTKPVVVSQEISTGQNGNLWNMVIPLLVMVGSMPIFLVYTGWDAHAANDLGGRLWSSISNGSGATAVLYAIGTSLVVAGILYGFQKKLTLKSYFEQAVVGMGEMVTMSILMVMAFAIGNICNEMGTGKYVAEVTAQWLSPGLAPMIIFITSCFIAFSTGTSWGTFAIMMSIAMPLALTIDANVYLVVAAVLGGGVFGDHCSPISDTSLIASIAAQCDHIDHVRTQLPYALATGALSALLYLLLGLWM